MSCNDIRPQLTAYLDGEVDADRGSVIRGHLRGCSACRDVARDEAALRDGLRDLPPLDPPASLWSGVQVRLAAAEVADAERPRWRRTLAQIARLPEHGLRGLKWLVVPRSASSRFALGGMVASAAIVLAYWRTHAVSEYDGVPMSTIVEETAYRVSVALQNMKPATPSSFAPSNADVTDDLAADNARTTARYNDAADELYTLAADARAHWSSDRQQAFDARVAKLRGEIASAQPGRARQRAQRELVRYLQGAAVRDQVVAMAGGIP